MNIEGLKRVEIKVCKIKEYYFDNNKKKTRIVNDLDCWRNTFALIQDENKNTYVFKHSHNSIGKKVKQINKGEKYIFYVYRSNINSYLNIDYITNINDELEIEKLSLKKYNEVPKDVFYFVECLNEYNKDINFNDVKLITALPGLGLNHNKIIWLLENMNIKNDLLKYCYVFKWLNEISKETSYAGANPEDIYKIYKNDILNIFDNDLNINEILINLRNMNMICHSYKIDGNYYPEYFNN